MKNYIKADIIRYLLLLPIFLSLLITTKTLDWQVIPRYLTFSSLLFLVSVFFLAGFQKTKISLTRNVKIFLVLLLIFSAISGISLFFTINLSDGFFGFSKIVLFGIYFFLLILGFQNPKALIKYFTRSIVILTLILCSIGFYQVIQVSLQEGISHSNLYKVTVTFGHKNLFIEYIFLLFPFCIYTSFSKSKFWKTTGIIASISILASITLFMTRSVWVATFVATVSTMLIGVFFKIFSVTSYKKITTSFIIFLFIVSGVIFLYSKFDITSAFSKQFDKITDFQYGSVKDRLVLWNKSIEMFKESPIQGKGLGSWKIHILKFGNSDLQSENNLIFYQRPHNDYIWILCEQGIVALVSYLLIFAFAFFLCIKILKSNSDSTIKFFILALVFFLFGYLTISFFSFPFDRIEYLILLAFIFGLISVQYNSIEKTADKESKLDFKLLIICFIPIILLSMYFGAKRFSSEIHLKKAYKYRAMMQWESVISEIDKADCFFYRFDPYSTPLSWYKGLASFNLNRIEEAYKSFKQAYKYNPYHIYVLNDLGTTNSMLQKHESSIALYKKAIEIAPDFEDALYNITTLYYKNNEIDSAYKYFSRIVEVNNKLKYNKYIDVIVIPKIQTLLESIQENDMQNVVLSILNSYDWMAEIVRKSNINKIKFEKQLLLDVIYVLKMDTDNFSLKRKEILINKYNLAL